MSVLLQELDGFSSDIKKPIIFVGATNVPDQLDPALMRPGRFDKIIYMHLPDFNGRKAIFRVDLKNLPVAPDIDYDELARRTERYSGADIKNIVKETSALEVARSRHNLLFESSPLQFWNVLGDYNAKNPGSKIDLSGSREKIQQFLDTERQQIEITTGIMDLFSVKRYLLKKEDEAVRFYQEDAEREIMITTDDIVAVIKKIKPSVTLDHLETYNKFRMDYERRSGAEEKKPEAKGVRWDDVAGLDEVRQVLLEAIEIPLLHEDLMKEMDVKPSKGLLLFGPPGCGKTMIVKAAANELNANFLTISGSELMSGRERNPAAYVKEIFNRARESAPALIFIDEIEALAPSRETYTGGILTELLQELDGVKELKNVMLVGATNKPSALDSAILRPGRFDKIIYIPPPDMPARTKLFTVNLEKFLKDVDVDKLSRVTDGYSGADISSICQNVKMQAVRDKLAGKAVKLNTAALLAVISGRRPSITQKDLREYLTFMQEYGERK